MLMGKVEEKLAFGAIEQLHDSSFSLQTCSLGKL
jgi:hypothetical protein